MNTPTEPRHCTVVLVDYQQRLLPVIHRGSDVVAEAVRLADCARALGIRVIGTEQNPGGLGPNAAEIRSRCDTTISKMHFDGCTDGLVKALRTPDRPPPTRVVIAGCETHVCLMQTAQGLLRAGFAVEVAANACGTRFQADHDLALDRLQRDGALLASVEMIVFEWLGTCGHERFRAVLEILKAPRG